MVILSTVNIFARDLESLVAFYAGLFGLAEKTEQRSPIYRALDAGGVMIGFNGFAAYRLLNLDPPAEPAGISAMLTFDIENPADVTLLSERAERNGAKIVKQPYDTAYGSRQSVLRDPEGNVFRINAFRQAQAPAA